MLPKVKANFAAVTTCQDGVDRYRLSRENKPLAAHEDFACQAALGLYGERVIEQRACPTLGQVDQFTGALMTCEGYPYFPIHFLSGCGPSFRWAGLAAEGRGLG